MLFSGIGARATRVPGVFTVVGLGAALVACAAAANATVVFTGSGNNPEVGANASGIATFEIAGDFLSVTLTNTTDPRTASQGNALTGVTFDVDGAAPALALSDVALAAGGALWTDKFTSTTLAALDGSWTDVLGAAPLGAYGAATSGFGGRFNGGSISLGNSGPNYGIVAAGTFDGTNLPFGGAQFPFAQDSLTLTFSGATGITEAQLENVYLLFGTDGTGIVTTVPEPAALLLLALGALIGRRGR